MFRRFGGKVVFYVLTLMFFLVSLQNTWSFLTQALPDATWFFLVCMLVIYEGGFLMWLALLMHGSENIPRTFIAALMLLVTAAGIGVAAYFMLDGMMHKGISAPIDPRFLAFVPNVVIYTYLATFAALMLYTLASPQFFARISHMNAHGTAPSHLRQYQVEQLPVYVSPYDKAAVAQLKGQNQQALPAPKQQANSAAAQVQPTGLRNKMGNWFARMGAGLQNGNTIYTIQAADDAAQVDANEPEESNDDAQEVEQEPVPQPAMQQSAAPRQAAPYRKPTTATKGKRSAGDIVGLLEIIDAQMPGKSAPELARMVGCDASTVRRWRASKGGR